jgi:hypothetical protein
MNVSMLGPVKHFDYSMVRIMAEAITNPDYVARAVPVAGFARPFTAQFR